MAELFISFFKLGLTAFGGPAMAAYIRKVIVERKRLISDEMFKRGIALCQTIPGATMIQLSAYIGLLIRGEAGATVSFIGFALPSFILMFILSVIYTHISNLTPVISTFTGLRVIIIAIIAYSVVIFGRSYLKGLRDLIIVALASVMFIFGIHPILTIITAGILGYILFKNKLSVQSNIECNRNNGIRKNNFKMVIIIILISIGGLAILSIINKRLFELAFIMLRVDLFAFGGGFSALPLLFHEIVSVRSWLSNSVFMDGIVLGQITPGPIVITSTFIGYVLKGPLGALVATIYMFLPSFLIVISIEPYFNRLCDSPNFNRVVKGIICSFTGLLLSTAIKFSINLDWSISKVILVIIAFTALIFKVDVVWVVLGGIIISVLLIGRLPY
ncbi:MAG: chromate efflux transporter [bacterium]